MTTAPPAWRRTDTPAIQTKPGVTDSVIDTASGPEYFIGAMTGTSIDGLDLCLLDFSHSPPRLVGRHEQPLGEPLTSWLRALASATPPIDLPPPAIDAIDLLGMADRALAEATAAGVHWLLDQIGVTPEAVRAIGSHGQTIRHRPDWHSAAFTLQIGDPSRIAELTGIGVAADFRRRDFAAGGQGAPLVPPAHAALFPDRRDDRDTLVINLGGIANVSVIRPGESPAGFDTGPANTLMDAWHSRHQGAPFDRDGRWAAQGEVHEGLLACLLSDPFFRRPAPKSTGPEQFNLDWLDRRSEGLAHALAAEDVQATLLELTAASIGDALSPWLAGSDAQTNAPRVILCGGGALNRRLRERLRARLKIEISSSEAWGLPPESVEGAAFAWLARQLLNGAPGNAPEVTGARGPRLLGGFYPA